MKREARCADQSISIRRLSRAASAPARRKLRWTRQEASRAAAIAPSRSPLSNEMPATAMTAPSRASGEGEEGDRYGEDAAGEGEHQRGSAGRGGGRRADPQRAGGEG